MASPLRSFGLTLFVVSALGACSSTVASPPPGVGAGAGGQGTGGDDGGGGVEVSNRPESVVCGTETCTGGDVCITRPLAPECEIKADSADPCPQDKPNVTMCGGAGVPCCCEDTPDPLTECSPASGCGDFVDCTCLGSECPSPMICSPTGTEGAFLCEDPPVP